MIERTARMLTQHTHASQNYWKDGIVFVDDVDAMGRSIRYFLDNDDVRREVAATGKQLLQQQPYESNLVEPINVLLAGKCPGREPFRP